MSTLFISLFHLGIENIYISDYEMDFEAKREEYFVKELKKKHSKKSALITCDGYFETINELITEVLFNNNFELLNCGDTLKQIRKSKD